MAVVHPAAFVVHPYWQEPPACHHNQHFAASVPESVSPLTLGGNDNAFAAQHSLPSHHHFAASGFESVPPFAPSVNDNAFAAQHSLPSHHHFAASGFESVPPFAPSVNDNAFAAQPSLPSHQHFAASGFECVPPFAISVNDNAFAAQPSLPSHQHFAASVPEIGSGLGLVGNDNAFAAEPSLPSHQHFAASGFESVPPFAPSVNDNAFAAQPSLPSHQHFAASGFEIGSDLGLGGNENVFAAQHSLPSHHHFAANVSESLSPLTVGDNDNAFAAQPSLPSHQHFAASGFESVPPFAPSVNDNAFAAQPSLPSHQHFAASGFESVPPFAISVNDNAFAAQPSLPSHQHFAASVPEIGSGLGLVGNDNAFAAEPSLPSHQHFAASGFESVPPFAPSVNDNAFAAEPSLPSHQHFAASGFEIGSDLGLGGNENVFAAQHSLPSHHHFAANVFESFSPLAVGDNDHAFAAQPSLPSHQHFAANVSESFSPLTVGDNDHAFAAQPSLPSHQHFAANVSESFSPLTVGDNDHAFAAQPSLPSHQHFAASGFESVPPFAISVNDNAFAAQHSLPGHQHFAASVPEIGSAFRLDASDAAFGPQEGVASLLHPLPSLFKEPQPHAVHKCFEEDTIMCIEQDPPNIVEAMPEQSASSASTLACPAAPIPAAPLPVEKHVSIIRPADEKELPFRTSSVALTSGKVLAAVVQTRGDSPGLVEWEWSRAVDAAGVKSSREGRFLKGNMDLHKSELIAAEISQAELMYRGAGSDEKGNHTMASRAFLLLILLLTSNKSFSAQVKANAMSIAMELVQLGVKTLYCACSFVGLCYITGKGYIDAGLEVDQSGVVKNLGQLIQQHPGALWAWNQLMEKPFCSQKIISHFSNPSLWDFILFLAWAKNSPSIKRVWKDFGQFMWPQVLHVCGRVLDALAVEKSQGPLQQLPLLRSRKGRSKKITPWINKLILLKKMKLIRHHRKIAASSHSDIIPKNSQIVMAEHFLTTSIYMKKLQSVYQDCFHFSCHWDPSSYDVETMVSIVYSCQADAAKGGLAAYLPIQNMKPLMRSEVDPEILTLSSMNKLTRIAGFSEIRALSHSLKPIGMTLEKFCLPKNFLWKALNENEKRILRDGAWWIVSSDGKEVRQIPSDFNIKRAPTLISLSDQGGINRAGLDYLVHSLNLNILVSFDPYHRAWNDLKLCLKSSKGDLFKCFLSFALLWNCNYGPFGSKEWFQKKKQKLADYLQFGSAHQEPFLDFIPWICMERQVPEPSCASEREALFNTLSSMNSFNALGPVVKLMRWFSWFQCEHYFQGENWSTKLIMLETSTRSALDGTDFVRKEEGISIKSGLSDKAELGQLKAKHGTWALAPLLVTPTSMFQKDLIAVLCNPCWNAHSWMSANLLTPSQVAKATIAKAQGAWSSEVYQLVLQGFHSPSALKKLYPFQGTSETTKEVRLSIHFDFLAQLTGKRAMSLAAQFLRPPIRYAGLLSTDPVERKQVQEKMDKEWKCLLGLEAKDMAGVHVRGIDGMHFLKTSVARLAFLLNEQDLLCKSDNAATLMHSLVYHFGDTVVVENTHQSAKDMLAEARHNQRSRVHKMQACLDAKILQTRQTNHISVSDVELSMASPKGLPSFIPFTHPNSFPMKKEFQLMMKHKSGSHWWPATTANSQFEEVVALEFLLGQQSLESPQLSCLAGEPGSVIASGSKGLVCMVLSKSTSGVLVWTLEPVPQQSSSQAYACIKNQKALTFVHITSLDEWEDIPVKPALHNSHGALIMLACGEHRPLPLARAMVGLDLTVKQCSEVLFAANVKLPQNTPKLDMYKAFMETFVPADLREDALAKSKAKVVEDDGGDDEDRLSDYQEILGMIEEDTHNKGDPDIKGEKEKIKKRKARNPKRKQVDDGVLLEPPKRKKGKGKGKGKGGRKGRGRGKGLAKRKAQPKPGAQKKRKIAAVEPIADIDVAKPIERPTEKELNEMFGSSPAIAEQDGDLPPDLAVSVPKTQENVPEEILSDCDYSPTPPGDLEHLFRDEPPAAETPTLAPASDGKAGGYPEEPCAQSQAASVEGDTSKEPIPEALPSHALAPKEPESLGVAGSQPAASRSTGSRGPKVYSSPATLQAISPPGCSIRLNRALVAPGVFCNCFTRHCFHMLVELPMV